MSKKKRNIIILIVVLALININYLLVFCFLSPSLKLNGEKELTINVNSEYTDAGVQAKYLGKDVSNDVVLTGEVNSSLEGEYILTYKLNKGIMKKEIKRKVIVKDMEAPTIELIGEQEISVCPNKEYIEEGYTATDNIAGDITDKVEIIKTTDKIIYKVKDASGNETTKERNITYVDNEAPIITLKGGNSYTIYLNEQYNEPGYTAMDNCDEDLTNQVIINGNVDNTKVGKYNLNYEVSDSKGNKASMTREVYVKEKLKGGIVYLTFDDGPGQYTADILNILAQNDIKATFFVTNQFPKYQDMIKKEYEAGHTVAVHTYTHNWNIYDSVDNYLNDFNKMNEIVYQQTGTYSKYFRFPGGSSNTVSRKHKVGVMTDLANVMTSKGYTYFDWNVDCGDTHKDNTVNYIINNIKKYVTGEGSYIILMHDIKKNTLLALPSIISYLKNNNYTFRAIDDFTPVKHFKIAN